MRYKLFSLRVAHSDKRSLELSYLYDLYLLNVFIANILLYI